MDLGVGNVLEQEYIENCRSTNKGIITLSRLGKDGAAESSAVTLGIGFEHVGVSARPQIGGSGDLAVPDSQVITVP